MTSALNFDTPDCQIVGGCDVYLTKAAGSDKKLYKNIENTLETQHESLVRLSASLSPPQAESLADSLNLSRSSPFGPLSQLSSRRTFAYLIATLNASHPDYDFSHILRPTDFHRERSVRSVISTIDTTLYNLRPQQRATTNMPPRTPGGSQAWGPKMWEIIDKEMKLKECAVYCYAPEEDPFDGEEGAIWSLNYFFFNKQRKRVCYLYLRGLSIISHSPVIRPSTAAMKRTRSARSTGGMSTGARKRARYWLGDRADADDIEGGWGEEDEEDEDMLVETASGVVYHRDESPLQRMTTARGPAEVVDLVSSDDDDDDSDQDAADRRDMRRQQRRKSDVRALSEEITASMEV